MSHEQKRKEYLMEKFNMPDGLQIEGKPPDANKPTLEDLNLEKDRQDQKGFTLAVGSTRYKGQKLKIYFDRSR